jgi:hypothetical protein
MTPAPGKLRTRAHVLADLSVNHVERQVLLCGCSVQRIYSDYGYDLIMSTFKPSGEIEGGNVFFQVKATDSLPLLTDHKTISWVVSRRDLRLWLNEAPDHPGRLRWATRSGLLAARASLFRRSAVARSVSGRTDHQRASAGDQSAQPPLNSTDCAA